MAYNLEEPHLKEINHLSILEPIDEKFDGITSMLSDNAVMYGSTVTSLLTGLPIEGDLDISVSKNEFMELAQTMANSVKWIQIAGKTIAENNGRIKWHGPSGGAMATAVYSQSESKSKKNPYEDSGHLPVAKVIAFETVNGACVQVIESRTTTGDPLEDALEVVRKVDFTFCGIAVDKWGRVLEVLPHAYSDCLARVIRIGVYQHRCDILRMKARIFKYVRRGWGLTFSIDQAMRNLRQAKLEHAMEKPKKKKYKKPASCFRIIKEERGVVLVIKHDIIELIGARERARDVVVHFAHQHGFSILTDKSSDGIRYYSKRGTTQLTFASAKKVVTECNQYFARNHNCTQERLIDIYKNRKMKAAKAAARGSSKYGYSTSPYVKSLG